MKFSLCIEMIFNYLPFTSRIEAAVQTGAEAVEFWSWNGKDIAEIAQTTRKLGIAVAGCCVDSADEAVRSGICMVREDGRAPFVKAVAESCKTAHLLGTTSLIATTGNEQLGMERRAQHDNIVRALRQAAPIAESEGITLCLEPLNILVNHKGYYLSTSAEGFEILDEVGSPNVKLLFDIYHQQITEGNVIANLTAGIAKIGHFHMADVPGRNQSGTGELNYRNIFAAIERAGYDRYVGMEYMPTIDHTEAVKATIALRP